ncbi:uncharacterized protein F5Z01DRAFT_472174 [Emericellopsis atlantica]|uniref:Protein kinase domain-containing protein n=1 Tax=Emericellopsis atlantica TaxID=2614577 RepID=A0A9P8CK69_9HYPO|nr:uncharacterized protein F5Z01DRAFT_472174 [Emericellopsis atlantica]KAG9249630.1 hypothetical protein F5Z01DRAFT_472174 [Emericellopsis atlantica]
MAQQSHSRTTRMWISDRELAIQQAPNKTSRVPGTDCAVAPLKLRKERKVDETNVDGTRLQTPSSGTDSALPLQAGSPWRRYKAILSLLDMGDKVIVASERAAPMSRVGVRRFPRGNQDTETLSRLREVRHANIVAALEAFQGQKILYIVFEDMHMPLDHVIRCPRRRTSDEVGTIVGQILDGLDYLDSHRWCHSRLSCETILVQMAGDVKIGMQELCRAASSREQQQNLTDIGTITIKLMQGYALEEGKVGVEDLSDWQESSILDFLSAITSSDRAGRLRKNIFLVQIWEKESRWPKEILCDLFHTAQLSVRRYYHYKP